jgi:hypothetical protein
MLLEECFVVAFLLRRIMRRRPTGHNQTLHEAAGDSAIVAAYTALMDGACAAHWSTLIRVVDFWVQPGVQLARSLEAKSGLNGAESTVSVEVISRMLYR